MQRCQCLALAFGELMDEIFVSGCVVQEPDRACAAGWHKTSLGIRLDDCHRRNPPSSRRPSELGVRETPHFPLAPSPTIFFDSRLTTPRQSRSSGALFRSTSN